MAIIDKKQKRWYADSTFESLDKTAIPIGTEIQVSGKLGQGDFDDDTNTKLNAINGKLNAPTDEITADSVPVISSTGTVSAQPFKKYYKHKIHIIDDGDGGLITQEFDIYAISSKSDAYTLNDLDTNGELLKGSMVHFFEAVANQNIGMFLSYSSSVRNMIFMVTSTSASIQLSDSATVSYDVVTEL